MPWTREPGWGESVRLGVVAVIPFALWLLLGSRPRLVAMRGLLVASVVRIVVLGLVVAVLLPERSEGSTVAWVLVAVGAVDAVLVARSKWLWPKKVVEGKDPVNLFWMTYLMSCAIAQTPALIGFVGFFLGAGLPVYAFGAVASFVALAGVIPTRRYVEAFQERLEDLGLSIDLHAAIRTTS